MSIETDGFAFPKPETVRLYGKDRQELREFVFRRDNAKCKKCGMPVVLKTGLWCSAHLAHIQGVGAGGEDTPDNTRILCLWCHGREHNSGGKPCPPKVQP